MALIGLDVTDLLGPGLAGLLGGMQENPDDILCDVDGAVLFLRDLADELEREGAKEPGCVYRVIHTHTPRGKGCVVEVYSKVHSGEEIGQAFKSARDRMAADEHTSHR